MDNLLNKNSVVEMTALIKSGDVSVVRNEYGDVVAINVNNPELKVKDIKYTKTVGSSRVVGSTLEELEADERKLRAFMEQWSSTDVMHVVRVAEVLAKDVWTAEDKAYIQRELESYVERNKEVREVTRTVTVPASESSRGRYVNIPEELEALDDEDLKDLKRTATRLGLNDLKNACRTALRHKGYNC